MVNKLLWAVLFSVLLCACSRPSQDAAEALRGTPVTVTQVKQKYLNDTLSFYGTLQFLNKTAISSPITGFVHAVNIEVGDQPPYGKTLFTIQSKEAAAYPKEIADTMFKNSLISVKASHVFQIDSILVQSGDFVQEGQVLCQIVDPASMVVQLNFPFEKTPLVKAGRSCEVLFPDGKKYVAAVSKVIPEVDAASQTQLAYVKMKSSALFPEKLNVTVIFVVAAAAPSYVLPSEAVLTDETMHQFWVMKLINDTTAVKENVLIGKKSLQEIEISYPVFDTKDRILLSGNYGLPDTARVMLQ